MIIRSPGTWGTISGEGMDNDSSTGIGMSGLQHQQQVKAAGSPRPGSSGSDSSSSSSSGWGTCSELLLVSAVKKHGVPNWNLVALELKARAILLNIPPLCFTEEACKFKYNALKGKFASTSSSGGGGSVSSPDEDLNGMTWFEELRKLRMSHLKEELQVYDSSIGQLQSRISKLQEERACGVSPQFDMKLQFDSSCEVEAQPQTNGCKASDTKVTSPTRARGVSPQFAMKLQFDSSCKVDAQHPSKGFKASDTKVTSPTPQSGDLLEISEDSTPTHVPQAAPPAENLVTNDFNRQQISSEMASEKPQNQEDSPGTSTPRPTGQDSTDEVERGPNLASVDSIPTESHTPEMVLGNGEERAPQVRVDEIRKVEPDLDLETSTSTSAEALLAGSPSREGGDGKVSRDGIDATVADDIPMPEKEVIVGLEEEAHGEDPEPDDTASTLFPPPGSPSTSTAVDIPEDDLRARDPPETLGVTSEPSRSGALEAEARTAEGSSKDDSIYKRESRDCRLSLSYGRAEKEKRLKEKEEAKQERMFAPEVREVQHDQHLESTAVEGVTLRLEERKIEDASVPLEQRENGGTCPCDPPLVDEVDRDGSPDPSTPASGDGANIRVEGSGLDNDSTPIEADPLPSVTDVLDARSDLVSSKGAEPRSPEEDIPLLTVSLGPEPDLVEPPSSLVTAPTLENIPDAENEMEVFHGDNLQEEANIQPEMPNEVKSRSSSVISAETDGKSEEGPQEVNDVIMESETVEVGQGEEEAKLDEVVDVLAEGDGRETLETDPGISRSVGEDVAETLDTKGSENGQEESRGGPETGEVQQPFPDYTDSQVDKSEVGSSMDSVEDMSPSSRKNRREPKVPGKFFPLLECLRVICAHKFAPLFRQRQEYQDNSDYDRLVRRHVDLSMVRARLEDGAYSGSVEFFRDLLLIFTNALVYNSSDSPEYVGAKALRSCALTEMDKILQTEALLKQNGPATRKREVRKSMEVHKVRAPSTSAGSEVRKKGILKGSSSETPAALDNNNSQGGAKSAHIAFEHTPHAGRSSNNNDVDRDLDGKIDSSFRKGATYRVVKEEPPRKESQKSEFLGESGSRSAGGTSGKKVKVDRDAQKTSQQGQVLADLRASVGRQNVESIGTKTNTAKMKDVVCIDLEKKGTPNNSSSLVSSGLPSEKQRTMPISRQTSTSRVSRYSKRGGDSKSSNPKKRARK